MKRIPVIIALFLAVPLIAVAQHQQGNVANVPDQKFDVPTVLRVCHHYPMTAPQPITKVACEKVGGTWDDADSFYFSPNVSPVSLFVETQIGDVSQAVDVDSQTGRVVKLSDEEYAHLQKLRQAVADEEKKIAIAHGVDTEGDLYPCGKPTSTILSNMSCAMPVGWNYKYPDRWQFRGQWLLINLPKVH